MAVERTLAILKPDCVRKNLQGEIIARIQKAGFTVLGMKQIRLTKEMAGCRTLDKTEGKESTP